MSRLHARAAWLLVLVVLAGCATAPRAEPTARELLALGYTTVQLAAETTLRLHEAGVISDAKRAETREQLRSALAELDAATAATVDGREPEALYTARAALLLAQAVVADLRRVEALR